MWIPFYYNVYESKHKFLLHVNYDRGIISGMDPRLVSVFNKFATGEQQSG